MYELVKSPTHLEGMVGINIVQVGINLMMAFNFCNFSILYIIGTCIYLIEQHCINLQLALELLSPINEIIIR